MADRPPTRRQVEVLRAYIATGSIAAAAYELGISETTGKPIPFERLDIIPWARTGAEQI